MTVTVAILGGGFMGSAHAANYAALGERVRVKTVASRTLERAARVAEIVGAPFTSALLKIYTNQGIEEMDINLKDMMPGLFGGRIKQRKMRVDEAVEYLEDGERPSWKRAS